MVKNTTIGLDIAKTKFHLVILDDQGKKIAAKKLLREDVLPFFAILPDKDFTLVALEACGSSHYWAEELCKLGFPVRMLKPSDVKPFARARQKNDTNDALAIAKAARDPELRAVAIKTKQQRELQWLHKRRDQLLKQRIENSNALRAMLAEFGFACNHSPTNFLKYTPQIVAEAHQSINFSTVVYSQLTQMLKLLDLLCDQLNTLERSITDLAKQSKVAQQLLTIPGIGVLNASFLSVLALTSYETARDFAASLGLVPKQYTTGGNIQLGSITKRGNRYARKLLVQGARSLVMLAQRNYQPNSSFFKWVRKMANRLGFNKASVAVANKLARIAWAVVTHNQPFAAD